MLDFEVGCGSGNGCRTHLLHMGRIVEVTKALPKQQGLNMLDPDFIKLWWMQAIEFLALSVLKILLQKGTLCPTSFRAEAKDLPWEQLRVQRHDRSGRFFFGGMMFHMMNHEWRTARLFASMRQKEGLFIATQPASPVSISIDGPLMVLQCKDTFYWTLWPRYRWANVEAAFIRFGLVFCHAKRWNESARSGARNSSLQLDSCTCADVGQGGCWSLGHLDNIRASSCRVLVMSWKAVSGLAIWICWARGWCYIDLKRCRRPFEKIRTCT